MRDYMSHSSGTSRESQTLPWQLFQGNWWMLSNLQSLCSWLDILELI